MRLWPALIAGVVALTPANAVWREAKTEHFVIYSEESERSLRTYAERLERVDAALRHVYPVPKTSAGGERLTVYALKDGTAVQRVMGTKNSAVRGVYHPSASGSIALTARDAAGLGTQVVLLHEYAHHFMLNNFTAAYPAWFVEGFAEFVSTARVDAGGGVGLGIPAHHRAGGLYGRRQITLRQMLANDLRGKAAGDFETLYSHGWLLTHYLMFNPARKGQLTRYLDDINRGSTPAQAAAVFGDLTRLDLELDGYSAQSSMRYMAIAAKDLPVGPIAVRAVSEAENAIIPVRIESKYGVGHEEARQLVPRARAAAAPFPQDVAAQCMLAEAEHDAGDNDAADRAADRALAIDGKAYCALLYKGHAAFSRAKAAKGGPDNAGWAEARRWFARANRADTTQALPMYLYYTTFSAAGAPPTANAIEALLASAMLAPQDADLRLAAAVQLLREDRPRQAAVMLGPVVNGHEGGSPFLSGIFARIGKEPSARLADELAHGPAPAPSPAPAG